MIKIKSVLNKQQVFTGINPHSKLDNFKQYTL